MARAMGSLSSFGQSMGSVAHNLTGDFRGVWTFLYEGSPWCFLFDFQHPMADLVCIFEV